MTEMTHDGGKFKYIPERKELTVRFKVGEQEGEHTLRFDAGVFRHFCLRNNCNLSNMHNLLSQKFMDLSAVPELISCAFERRKVTVPFDDIQEWCDDMDAQVFGALAEAVVAACLPGNATPAQEEVPPAAGQ